MNTGLEHRLRTVPGVASLRIDLGRDGLEGIHVTVDEGSDETVILEEIRRILVAYGLRARENLGWSEHAVSPIPTTVWMGEVAGRTGVRLTYEHGVFEGYGELSWAGAVKACVEAIATATGRVLPSAATAVRQQIDGVEVLLVLVSASGVRSPGVAIIDRGVAHTLVTALTAAMTDLSNQLSVDLTGR